MLDREKYLQKYQVHKLGQIVIASKKDICYDELPWYNN